MLDVELVKKEIRPTAVRLRVLEQFQSDPAAVSLNELEEKLQPVDRTTLFRTLKMFEKKGVVHAVHDENGIIKYALCADSCRCSYSDHLHVHFSCKRCKKTTCLHDVQIPEVMLPQGYVPQDANVVIKGVCNLCSGL